jgi:threonine/homoserine/homoserine lactone efflux protein
MNLETWVGFLLTETVLCLTPGPAVLLVVAHGLARGPWPSIWASLGILAGNGLYFVVSATGLSAVIMTSNEFFSMIRWVGAAYLIWLGVTTFFGRSARLSVGPAAGPAVVARPGRIALDGFVLQTANPKALVFFVALLPQFIDPAGSIVGQVAILGVTSVIVEFGVLLGYGVAASRASEWAARPRWPALTNRLAGGMLVAAGVGVARASRE